LPVSKRGRWVRTVDEISKLIVNLIRANDIVMLKASNGMGLFKLVSELKAMGKTFENHRKGI
jgi:UDP-N-acetylmuramyl pentapeptide synthase